MASLMQPLSLYRFDMLLDKRPDLKRARLARTAIE